MTTTKVIRLAANQARIEKHTAMSDEDFAKDLGRNRLAVVLSRTNHMSYHLDRSCWLISPVESA
jgi:hypothetical protein